MSEQEVILRLTREQAADYDIAMLHAGQLAAVQGDMLLLAKIHALRGMLHEALYPEKEGEDTMNIQDEKYPVGRIAWEIGNAHTRSEYPALPLVTWDDLSEEDKALLDAQMREKISREAKRDNQRKKERTNE